MVPHLPIPLYALTFIFLTISVAIAGRSIRDLDNSSPTDTKYNGPVGLDLKEGRPDLSPEDMEIEFPVTLDKILSTMVTMPMKKKMPNEQAMLEVTAEFGIKTADFLRSDMKIKLYIMRPQSDMRRLMPIYDVLHKGKFNLELDPIGNVLGDLGSFVTKPEPGTSTETTTTTMRFPMSESLKKIGAENAKAVEVVLVPTAGKGLQVVIKDIKIEYVPV